MTAEEWTERFARALNVPAPNAAQVDAILELAGSAAHGSERTAAPVACWLAATAGVDPVAALAVANQLREDN